VRTGDLYRLASPFQKRSDGLSLASWMYVSADRSKAVLFAFNPEYFELVKVPPRILLNGLDPRAIYKLGGGSLEGTFSGAILMSVGLVADLMGDAKSVFVELVQVAKSAL